MYTLIKTYKCFGNLSIENGNPCPDKTIYVDSFKNGKSKVTIFDGAVTKPRIIKKFSNVEGADKFIKQITNDYPFVKEYSYDKKAENRRED